MPLTIISVLVVLSILILVHELGHFLLAKRAGVKIEEFGFGYPPRIIGKKIGETIYSLNWIPFGGFVRLYGEELQDRSQTKDNQRAFWAKSKLERASIILAGVVFNFLLGIVCFSIVYSVLGIPTEGKLVRIGGVMENSPAAVVGLQEGDVILGVDGQDLTGFETGKEAISTFAEVSKQKQGEEIGLVIERQNGELNFSLTPRIDYPENEGPIGVVISSFELKKYPFWQMPFRAGMEGIKEAFGWTVLIASSFGGMIRDLVTQGAVPKDIAGPIGIVQITGQVARTGLLNLIQFVGILSINLTILNILPLPALDGGRLTFLLYETITKKKPKPEIEGWINTIGMGLIITLMLLVTFNDLTRILDFTALMSKLGL